MSLDVAFKLNKQYFTVGETIDGEILIHPSKHELILKNGYLSLLVQEKVYHPVECRNTEHKENVEIYPFYNLKYQLFQKVVLSQMKIIPFRLILPYNAPGTYNGHIASCNWYLIFDCDIDKNGKTEHFNTTIEFAVFAKEYSIEI